MEARLRAAQIAVIARHTPAMIVVNLISGLMLVAAFSAQGLAVPAAAWFAALAAVCMPVAFRVYRRRHKLPPATVGPKVIRSATVNASVLGGIWGLAAMLFFNPDRHGQIILVCILAGMICGGSLALSTLPRAVVAFATPIVGGSFIGLLLGAKQPIDYFIAPLLATYSAAIILAGLSQGQQFATRVIAQARAEALARHDPLTGLPNRVAFESALDSACQRLERYGERFALLYIDLDDFKVVNDRYGHQAGDQLLKQMAGRLSVCLREVDMLARLGGDEFVMIARGLSSSADAATLADRLAEAFDGAFTLEGGSLECRASVGVALAPTDGATPNALINRADAALYAAKRERNGAFHLFAHGEHREVIDRRALAQDIKGALGRGEFFLQFQPIQDLATGRIKSNETLARWRHPERGLVPPVQFITIAERLGLIHELGEWIMFEACREAALWPADVGVAVNVSPEQICDDSIVNIVEAALRAARLSPRRLHLEVTESAILAASDAASAIERLHERGVAIVLDDFGTGFSSFDHVRRLPAAGLKIDRSFVAGLPERRNQAIVQAVAHLARSLDLDVTAEGIETPAQLGFVKAAGCTHGQGYLISRPQDAETMRATLAVDRAA
ncbi:MAG: EAL domain-containing protein [Rhodoblastus sp.]|nr:EAL domain-containing protein [Rhodoblastus sp.]